MAMKMKANLFKVMLKMRGNSLKIPVKTGKRIKVFLFGTNVQFSFFLFVFPLLRNNKEKKKFALS